MSIPAIAMKTDLDGNAFPPPRERPILFSGPMVRRLVAGTKTVTRRLVKPQLVEPKAKELRHAPKHPGPYFDAYCSERKRVENPRGMSDRWCWWTADDRPDPLSEIRCPYGAPGDRLWVRETFYCDDFRYKSAPDDIAQQREFLDNMYYRADAERTGTVCELIPECMCDGSSPWKPGIHMPRWAARIVLEVIDVRVERLWAIDDKDARREGVVEGIIPADEDGPRRIGYVLGDDDGKCVLYPDERKAFAAGWDAINGARASWDRNPWVWRVAFQQVEEPAR